jgi:hypothetical protein
LKASSLLCITLKWIALKLRLKHGLVVLLCLSLVAAAHAQLPTYVPESDLVAWYGFNGNANDASANNLAGNTVDVESVSDRSGYPQSAYRFNGQSSQVVVPFNSAFNSFPFSVSLWCRPEADDNGSMLIQQYSNASWNGWVMSMSGTGTAQQTISPGYMLDAPPTCNGVVSSAACATGINYSADVFDNQWHMLTFTVDGDSGRFYYDGILQTTQEWTGPAGAPTGTNDLRIGGTDMGSLYFFNGTLDDVGIWSRALTAVEVETLYLTLPPIAGCTNTNACNYLPEATINDGSCVFNCAGCIDPCACNYNQNAAYNDGSCDYSCNQGMTFITVFNDANANGSFESDEQPMQYWPVKIVELEKIVYTDVAGMILVPLPAGTIHYELLNTTAEWISTTLSQVEVVVPGNTQAFFGLQHSADIGQAEAEILPGYYEFMHCDYGLESGLYVRNTGGQVLHGTVSLTCDPAFNPSAAVSLSVPPSISGPGFAHWNVEDLKPWETRLLAFFVAGPGSQFLGQTFEYTIEIELLNAFNEPVLNNLFNAQREVRCDEQPARLQSDPRGFNDIYHYVEDGADITFRVQFQNNTGEWADDVLVIQNLNSQQFELNSFELLYASEAIVGCLHDDGTIDLEFSNLVVAPTGETGANAGGYAVYRARLHEGIAPDSTFYHDMHVVYDMNTAAGDTVFHTIYDCSRLAHVIGEEHYCEGDTVVLRADQVWIESYEWLVGDSLLSTEDELRIPFTEGFYNIVCNFSNPVCAVCEHAPVHVSALPHGSVITDGDVLYSLSEDSCQWYFNQQPIPGATQAQYNQTADGVYQVYWTNEQGCSAWSEPMLVNGVTNSMKLMSVHPNPADTRVQLDLPTGAYRVMVSDMSGRMVHEEPNFARFNTLDVSALPSGTYSIEAMGYGLIYRTILVVQ